MIVVDTNLLVYLYVEGTRTGQAEAVLRKDPMWAEAEAGMVGREYSVVSYEVLQLAASSGCSAYDCEFVALANDLDTRLITADRRILRAFSSVAVAPEVFAA